MSGLQLRLGAKVDNNKTKRNFFQSPAIQPPKESNQPQWKQRTKFDVNPLIVTRRNVSTAQTKKKQEEEDEDDLIYTSGSFRKKQMASSQLGKGAQQSLKPSSSRPQSKQQQKRKIIKLKRANTQTNNQRPQTSKGQRKKTTQIPKLESTQSQSQGKGITSKNKVVNQQLIQQLGNKGATQSNKLFFKTAIDSEFLSLFAK